MLRMILIIFGALFVLFCLIVCYCACVVAGREDRRMEALYMEHEMKQITLNDVVNDTRRIILSEKE